MSSKAIDSLVRAVAEGDINSASELMQLLCDKPVFMPLVEMDSDSESQAVSKIRVLSFRRKGRSVVPVFTSQERFDEWSAQRHQCFSVLGADFALTVPQGTWAMINPGCESSCELTPEQLIELGAIDASSLQTQTTLPSVNEEITEVIQGGDTDLSEASTLVISTSDMNLESSAIEVEETRAPATDAAGIVTADIADILANYTEVSEAYFQEIDGEHAHAVLGLLTTRVDAERRFMLIDEIAEISRAHFGMAGSIEVYDDLDLITSTSWELFNALAPFYVRDTESQGSDRGSQVREELEEPQLSVDAVRFGRLDEGADAKKDTAFDDIRKKSSRIFGALIGR